MEDAILDRILTELNNRDVALELTTDVMKEWGLTNTSPMHNEYIRYLEGQGYVYHEIIKGYETRDGYVPAGYYLSIKAEGRRFISEGGFTSKTEYSRKTLKVATQSRNWSIAGVAISVVALIVPFLCNILKKGDPVSKPVPADIPVVSPGKKDTAHPSQDTIHALKDSSKPSPIKK